MQSIQNKSSLKNIRGGNAAVLLIGLAPIVVGLGTILGTISPDKQVKNAQKARNKTNVGKEADKTGDQARKAAVKNATT